MTEAVWQVGRKWGAADVVRRASIRLFSRDRHPRLFDISVTLLYVEGSFDAQLAALL